MKLDANHAMFCPHKRLLINSGEFGEPIVEVLAFPKFESKPYQTTNVLIFLNSMGELRSCCSDSLGNILFKCEYAD